ncbi:hypothetical protein AAC03nite_39360 [Alicyclobacillus acidoterrestris]|nr:hypothetical protein AAC03nite_39360 [Alicyclobacillus acidoterrestris]
MPNINRLQPFQRSSGIYQALFSSESQQTDARQSSIDDLVNQMSVDTATWGLVYYEQDLGIVTDASQSYDERRSVIKSKMRGVGTVNRALIALVADSYTNGDVDVSFANSTITVTFTSVKGIPPNEEQFKAAISEIIPAHLAITYVYLYNVYSDFNGKFTYQQLDNSGLTYEQLQTQLPS